MKQFILTAIFALSLVNLCTAATASSATPSAQMGQTEAFQAFAPGSGQLNMDEFLSLTPAKYKKMTGEKLGLKKTIQLKVAQKALKMQMKRATKAETGKAADSGISKGLYIVLAIFGLAWIAMGVMDDWTGSTWIINLLLTLLFWLPGFIHSLIVMKKYYPS